MSAIIEKWRSEYVRFRPPKTNPAFIRFVQKVVLPILMPLATGIRHVEISAEDLHRLRALKGKRVVLVPNHSEGNEPYVLFHLSGLLHEEFNYLAAREVFERYFPAGPLLQAIGCYSVIRGAPDRNAFRTTRDLLIEGRHWIVAFPEGVAAGMGDLVMPFEEGVSQIAFSALDDLHRKGSNEPLYLLPMSVKPVYTGATGEVIDHALQRLEALVFRTPARVEATFRDRLIRLGEAIFSANERVYNIRPPKGATLNQRFQTLKKVMLFRIGGVVGVEIRPGQTENDYIRGLFNAVDRIVYAGRGEIEYEEKLLEEQRLAVKPLYSTLLRVFQFVAFDTRYFDEYPTVERFLDVLGLLEHEVLGKRHFYGPRTALVKVGDPVNLLDYKISYKDNKKHACREVTSLLQTTVQKMLRALSQKSHFLQPEHHKTGNSNR